MNSCAQEKRKHRKLNLKKSEDFRRRYQAAILRRGCMNELNMCCQTLCTRQAVFNYITHLEDSLKEAYQVITRLEKQGG